MKKIYTGIILAVLLSAISVLALDTKWSFRGNVDKDDVVLLYGMDGSEFDFVKGSANAYAYSTDRGFQSSGYVAAQTPNKRVSVSWNHIGNNYGVTLVSDDTEKMVFTANARVIWSYYNIQYQVPITVTYMKSTEVLNIKGATFEFNVDGINLL